MEELSKEEIIAMSVAAIAEMTGTDIKSLRVVRFREVGEKSLQRFIRENSINYKKYSLEDEMI